MAITALLTGKFDVDCESATWKKLVMEDVSNYVGEGIDPDDVTGTLTITFPDNDFAVVTILPGTNPINSTVAIPLDANGDYMTGSYTFVYSIVVTGAVQPGTYTQTTTYDYCPAVKWTPEACYYPCISVIANCFCLKITATDDTVYGTPTTITRLLTLYPPPQLALPSVSTSGSSLVYDFSYTGGYTISVNTAVTYVTGNITIAGRVKGSHTQIIKCDRNLCALYNCIKKFYAKLRYSAGQTGGLSTLSSFQQEQWDNVIAYTIQFKNALDCGQYNDADTFYDEIEKIVDCDCGCQEGDEPQLVNPYCGAAPGSGNTAIVVAGSNIAVSSSTVGTTTTYTVSLGSAFLALITSIQSDITTIQGDITTINNTLAALPPKQYYLLYDDATVSQTGSDTLPTELKAYTLPADTLEIGDILRIRTAFTFNRNLNNKFIELRYGSIPMFDNLLGSNAFPINVGNTYIFEFEVHKYSGPSIVMTRSAANGFGSPVVSTQTRVFSGDANIGAPVLIAANAQNGTASGGDITCIFLTVELIKAP